jgi:hypothetical protein
MSRYEPSSLVALSPLIVPRSNSAIPKYFNESPLVRISEGTNLTACSGSLPATPAPIWTHIHEAIASHGCAQLCPSQHWRSAGLRALSTTNRVGLSPPAHTGTSRRARLCDASPKHPNPQPSARKYITTSKFHAIWQCFSQPVIRQPEASFLAPPCLAQPHQKEAPSARPFIKPKRIGYPACPAPLRTPVDSLQPAACRPPYNRNARSRSCSHLRSVTVTAAQQLACSTPCCCRSETPRGMTSHNPWLPSMCRAPPQTALTSTCSLLFSSQQ